MSTEKKRRSLKPTRQQQLLQSLQYRYIPYFAIFIFSLLGAFVRWMIIPELGLVTHTLLFFLQAFVLTAIWHIVKALNAFLDKRIPFSEGPIMRAALQVALTMLIVGPVVGIITWVSLPYIPHFITPPFIGFGIAIFVVMIFLFNFGFYSYYFFRNWQESVEDNAELEVRAAELEREKFNIQYHQLKNQVNPHYLFNTLTSLDGLIQTNPGLASEFVRHMSKVYRYVLQHKENEVVSLEEELEFIKHYIELLHIRHAKGLQITYTLSPAALDKGVVMVTLQLLIDNAIKHNIVQPLSPLHIQITDANDYLVVKNNRQLRKQIETSNGHGLKQLQQLYSYLSQVPVVVEDEEEYFTIKIPLL